MGDAWRRFLLEGRLPGWAREALDGHAAAIGLDAEVAGARFCQSMLKGMNSSRSSSWLASP